MANSSMLVLPRITTSASLQPPGDRGVVRRDPALQDLRPDGGRDALGGEDVLQRQRHPGQRAQLLARARAGRPPRAAWASAPSRSTCRKACTFSSTASMRARWASVTSTAVTSPRGDPRGGLGGGQPDQSLIALSSSPRICGTLKRCCSWAGAPESACSRGQGRPDLVRAHDVGQRQRVGGRRYVLVGDLGDGGDRADDVVELSGEVVELFVLQLQTRQPGEVGDLLARDARHAAILVGRCGFARARAQSYGARIPSRNRGRGGGRTARPVGRGTARRSGRSGPAGSTGAGPGPGPGRTGPLGTAHGPEPSAGRLPPRYRRVPGAPAPRRAGRGAGRRAAGDSGPASPDDPVARTCPARAASAGDARPDGPAGRRAAGTGGTSAAPAGRAGHLRTRPRRTLPTALPGRPGGRRGGRPGPRTVPGRREAVAGRPAVISRGAARLAGPQPGRGLLGRHRGGDQPALDRVAAQVAQPLPGLVVLDALGDHQQAERVREVDGAADDLRVLGVDGEPGHEGPVDLQLADGQPPQVDQRGVAGAEVVEGHLHPVRGQSRQGVGGAAADPPAARAR